MIENNTTNQQTETQGASQSNAPTIVELSERANQLLEGRDIATRSKLFNLLHDTRADERRKVEREQAKERAAEQERHEEKARHAREQAEAQLANIKEMVGALTIEGAAGQFVESLENSAIIDILAEGIESADLWPEGWDEDEARETWRAGNSDAPDDDEPDTGELSRVFASNFVCYHADEARELIREAIADNGYTPSAFEWDEDEAREAIQQDPLSVEVRSGWHAPGEEGEPEEFCILLCTGGPAVRIVGDLDRGEPSRPRLEYQDWGTSWQELVLDSDGYEALQAYCACFFFGE